MPRRAGSAVVARCRDAVAALSPRFWDEVERRAFAAAEPEPLVLGPFFPQASAPDAPGDHAVESAPPLLPLVDADLAFLIDPIDGTRNYVAGLPLFGMMIAACHRGDVIAGVIYDPVNRDSALAVRGEGAWMEYENGRRAPLTVAGPAPLEDMDGLISTDALPEPLRTTVNSHLSRLGSTASLRCAAHEYRMLAAGHCHVALYNQLTAWDHAAGWLLHRETDRPTSPRTAPAACCMPRMPAAGTPPAARCWAKRWTSRTRGDRKTRGIP